MRIAAKVVSGELREEEEKREKKTHQTTHATGLVQS